MTKAILIDTKVTNAMTKAILIVTKATSIDTKAANATTKVILIDTKATSIDTKATSIEVISPQQQRQTAKAPRIEV